MIADWSLSTEASGRIPQGSEESESGSSEHCPYEHWRRQSSIIGAPEVEGKAQWYCSSRADAQRVGR